MNAKKNAIILLLSLIVVSCNANIKYIKDDNNKIVKEKILDNHSQGNCWKYEDADYFSCKFTPIENNFVEINHFIEKHLFIPISDYKPQKSYMVDMSLVIPELKSLLVPTPVGKSIKGMRMKELYFSSPITKFTKNCLKDSKCKTNIPPEQKEIVLTWNVEDELPTAAAIFLVFVKNNNDDFVLSYSYGRNKPPVYRKNEEFPKQYEWMLNSLSNFEGSSNISFRKKTSWQTKLEGGAFKSNVVDVFSIYNPDDILKTRLRVWLDRTDESKPVLLRVIPEFKSNKGKCLSGNTTGPAGSGKEKSSTHNVGYIDVPVFPISLDYPVTQEIELEDNFLKRDGQIFKSRIAHSDSAYCDEKENFNSKENHGITVNFTGNPVACSKLSSKMREANVFFHSNNARKVFDSYSLSLDKLPPILPDIDHEDTGGGLNCDSNSNDKYICLQIMWSPECRQDAFNPGLIVHEISHGIVKYFQFGRNENWCGWDNNCPEPTVSIIFHDFTNVLAHYITNSPCYPNLPSVDCEINDEDVITPFDVSSSNGSFERHTGQSIATILWRVYQDFMAYDAVEGKLTYETALLRTLIQYGWSETEVIRKTYIKCSVAYCNELEINLLYKQFNIFALLFKQNLSYDNNYYDIANEIFNKFKIYTSELNKHFIELSRPQIDTIRVWSHKSVNCSPENPTFNLFIKNTKFEMSPPPKCIPSSEKYVSFSLDENWREAIKKGNSICINNSKKESCVSAK